MHRDSLPVPLKRQLSRAASPKFLGVIDAITKYNEPTQTQLDALERSYNATGLYVMESAEFRDLTVTVHAQGSRSIGTLVRHQGCRFRRPADALDRQPEQRSLDLCVLAQLRNHDGGRPALVEFGQQIRLVDKSNIAGSRVAQSCRADDLQLRVA